MSPSHRKELERRLRSDRYWLRALVMCAVSGRCTVKGQHAQEIFEYGLITEAYEHYLNQEQLDVHL